MVSLIATSMSTTAGAGTAPLGVAGVVAVIAYLLTKELSGAQESPRMRLLAANLNVAIIPMLLVLALIVVMKVIEVL